MAIINRIFENCCDGTQREFDIESTTFVSGDTIVFSGECYFNTNVVGYMAPEATYLSPSYSSCTECQTFNPCVYTFSACCANLTFSVLNSEIPVQLSANSIYHLVIYDAATSPDTFFFDGCATLITGTSVNIYSGNTIDLIGPYNDCATCISTYPCCVSGQTDISSWRYTNCCDIEVTGTTIGSYFCFNPSYPFSGVSYTNTITCTTPCATPTPTPTPTITSTLTPTPTPTVTTTLTPTITETSTNTPTPTITETPTETPTPTITETPTETPTQTPTPTTTNTPTATVTPTITGSVTTTPTPTPTVTPTDLPEYSAIMSLDTPPTCGQENAVLFISASTNYNPITIQLFKDGISYESVNANTFWYFGDLGNGLYDALVTDSITKTARTQSVEVSASTSLSYGLSVSNNTVCSGNDGSVTITGLTGTAPYTFTWSNGGTGSTITGLTAGVYNLLVTDSEGCNLSSAATVSNVTTLQIINTTVTDPSCFGSDGEVQIIITGGTAPYYFSGSNSQYLTQTSTTYDFTGVSSGVFYVYVEDDFGCVATTSTSLIPPAGFALQSINITNSSCSANGGQVNVIVLGSGTFTYSLSGVSGSVTESTTSTNYTFSNVSSGTYNLGITGGTCYYNNVISVTATDKFSVATAVTGTTCGQNNGSLNVQVGTGYTGVLDYLLSNDTQIIDTSLTGVTFTGLSSGSYTVTVVDVDSCSIVRSFTINDSDGVTFDLIPTSCGTGNQGSITPIIYTGVPPFDYSWSNGSSAGTISSLTAGTYTLTLTDSLSCVSTGSTLISCASPQDSFQTISLFSKTFTEQPSTSFSLDKMYLGGYYDIASGETGCGLTSASFYSQVEISGYTATTLFYGSSDLTDVPTDNDYIQGLTNSLDIAKSALDNLFTYTINSTTNAISIKSTFTGTGEDPFFGQSYSQKIIIEYELNCIS